MANNFFSFKQFTIHQDACAMKVTTDGCLFGAIAANEISTQKIAGAVLDIGAGTGLLSLMIAQQNTNLHIDAIEIDDAAAKQASDNIANSVFKNQINLIHADITNYSAVGQYDAVISNPPFYKDYLKSPDIKRNKALHDSTLSVDNLFYLMQRLVRATGILAVLLPAHNMNSFTALAATHSWICYRQIAIRQTENHDIFRKISFFRKQAITPLDATLLTIKQHNEYSENFIHYLKGYYLYL